MQLPSAVIFDLDNTLAEPFHAPTPSMFARLEALIPRLPVAIMSAASFSRIQSHVLAHLGQVPLERLMLYTANAAQCYAHESGEWRALYKYGFSPDELTAIKQALQETVAELGIDTFHAHGQQFVDYEGYVAFTALGIDAPREERLAWDPNQEKRQRLRAALAAKLPQFDVFIGGSTSVDVTPKGINKRFGVESYADRLGVPASELLYVGDALYEGGNDAVVIPTGIQTRPVSGPADTEKVIDELLAL